MVVREAKLTMRTLRHIPCSRRRFLAGSCAALAVSSFSRRAAALGGPRILLIGDSMIAGAFGLFMEKALRKDHGLTVHRFGKSSTGLARPDFFDWPTQARQLVEEFEPDVSIVMFGGNDVQGLRMPDRSWVTWNQPEWKDEYARRVNALADILAPRDQRQFWVGMPVMRPEKFHARVQRVNTILRGELAVRRKAHFVDIWPVFADARGNYTDRVEVAARSKKPGAPNRTRLVRVRAGDGIHLTVAGAHHLTDHVLRVLAAKLDLA